MRINAPNTLIMNAGSSNVKLAFYTAETCLQRWTLPANAPFPTLPALPDAIMHRLVHGGTAFIKPTRITPDILQQLHQLSPLAPLHLPPALKLLEHTQTLWPQAKHIACFDTAFHQTCPLVATRFALPDADIALRRYGFHGLAYQSVVRQLGERLPARAVALHLGSGASGCALLNGQSMATTMGFSTLDGLPMRTRCGQLDAGVVLHWWRQGHALADIEHLLYHKAGLKGLSGLSGDWRELEARTIPEAAFARQYFCHHAAKAAASLAVDIGGLEMLIFSGGIGENSPTARQSIINALAFLPPFKVEIVQVNEEEEMLQCSHYQDY
jgi:acetate kinase